jgi:hypothetical protein
MAHDPNKGVSFGFLLADYCLLLIWRLEHLLTLCLNLLMFIFIPVLCFHGNFGTLQMIKLNLPLSLASNVSLQRM